MLQVLSNHHYREAAKANPTRLLGCAIPPEVELEMLRLHHSLLAALKGQHRRLVQFTAAARGAGTTRTVLTLAEVAVRHGAAVTSLDASVGDPLTIEPLRLPGGVQGMPSAPIAGGDAKLPAPGDNMVLVDTAPIHLSPASMALASSVGGTVVVARAGHTRNDEIRRAIESIEQCGGRCLGIVLNSRPRRWIGG
jgi:hypothetical protein